MAMRIRVERIRVGGWALLSRSREVKWSMEHEVKGWDELEDRVRDSAG
jgi:hypothetical protein